MNDSRKDKQEQQSRRQRQHKVTTTVANKQQENAKALAIKHQAHVHRSREDAATAKIKRLTRVEIKQYLSQFEEGGPGRKMEEQANNNKDKSGSVSSGSTGQLNQAAINSPRSPLKSPPKSPAPHHSPSNNLSYFQQQLLHQQQIQRKSGLQKLTADLAGLQFTEPEAAQPTNNRSNSPAQRPYLSTKRHVKQATATVGKTARLGRQAGSPDKIKSPSTSSSHKRKAEQAAGALLAAANAAALTTNGAYGAGGGYEDQMTLQLGESQQMDAEQAAARDAQETAEDAAILKRFKILQLVGTGNYARVYKSISANGKELAVKSINLSRTTQNYRQRFLPRELELLKKISHANICKIHEIIQISDRIFIVMQFCPRGTIADLLHKLGPLTEPVTRNLFIQTCDAINYLHSNEYAHRDIKVENILLDKDFTPRLTDFSYSINIVESANKKAVSPTAGNNPMIRLNDTFCGTLPYLSPEMIRQNPYDAKKTDVWSLGICLYVMLNDRLPFPFNDVKLMVKKQLNKDFKFKASIKFSEDVRELVNFILEPDYNKRFNCVEVIKHPWMKGLREKPLQ